MRFSIVKRIGAVAAAAVLGACALVGCSSTDGPGGATGDTLIIVGANSSPHAEILQVAADQLAEEGYTLEVKQYNDYVLPNTALESGDMDANYYQHISYLNDFNEQRNTDLVDVAEIHFEPMGIYAGKTSDLAALPDGAVIVVPNDATNEGRALKLLEQEGLIKLDEEADLTATVDDIVENPHGYAIEELEAAQIPRVLSDVDVAVLNGNYALETGLEIDDALAIETDQDEAAELYANVLVVRNGEQDYEKIKALVAALQSDAVKQYIEDTYNGSVIALF